jgi:hypothetical protein
MKDLEIKLKKDKKAENWVKEKPKLPTSKMIRLTVDVSPNLHMKLKLKCVQERITIADMIRGWIEEKCGG